MDYVKKFNHAKYIISRFGHRMTETELDKATGLWGRLVLPAVAQMKKSTGELVVDTSADDRKREEREKRERANTVSHDARPANFMNRLKNRSGKVPKHDGKPISHNSYKIKFPNGRIYQFTVNANGSVTQRESSDYVPTFTPEQLHKMHEHAQAEHKQQGVNSNSGIKEKTMEKSTPAAKPGLRASFYDRAFANRDTTSAPVISRPTLVARTFAENVLSRRFTRSTERLTGHQQAAVKIGLDPHTPGIERMSLDQMKAAAQQQAIESTKQQRQRLGIPEPVADSTKTVVPSFC